MGPLGFNEIIILLLIALVLFGPRKLPELGRLVGRGMAEFRRASNELKSTIEDEVRAYDASVDKPGAGSIAPPQVAGSAPPADSSKPASTQPESAGRDKQEDA